MQAWQAAQQFVGVPFKHKGRTPNGVDCSGLIVLTARTLGWEMKDLRYYGRYPWADGMREALIENFGPPVEREPQLNDVLVLQFPDNPPSHLAIVAPHPYGLGMIHTHGELGRVAFHRLDNKRRAMIYEVYQWPAKS